jgi:N-hydroxyarylamine O-acetyltransferase
MSASPGIPFDLEAYLRRVGLDAPPRPNEAGLRALHDAQFHAVPFENLDIQLGRGISLDEARLVAKLVHRRRGGYCFELNGLMLLALGALGFVARPLLARVHLGPSPSGRTHQLSLVDLGGRLWILDVGFGAGGLRAPLPLEPGVVDEGPHWADRLVERDPWGYLMQTREGGEWKDSYSFDLSVVTEADRAVGNHFTSTSTASHFVTSRVASLPTPDGRVSLRDFTLTTLQRGESRTRSVAPGPAYLEELRATFGIELDATYGDLREIPQP